MADEPPVLTEYRIIFALAAAPPRKLRATSAGEDEEMPGMVAFFDRDDQPFFWVPREHVLFIDRRPAYSRDGRDRDDDEDAGDGEDTRPADPPETGIRAAMARVAAASPARGVPYRG